MEFSRLNTVALLRKVTLLLASGLPLTCTTYSAPHANLMLIVCLLAFCSLFSLVFTVSSSPPIILPSGTQVQIMQAPQNAIVFAKWGVRLSNVSSFPCCHFLSSLC